MAEPLTTLPAGFQLDTLPPGFMVDGQKPEPDHAKANEALAKSVTNITSNAKQTASDIATLYGPVEMGLNAASGFVFGFPMYLGAGGATAAQRAMGILDPDTDPKEIATRLSQAVTYQPMSQAGQRLSEALMLPLTDLAAGAEKAGHKITDITGSPTLGSLTEATIEMLPAPFLGALGRKAAGKVPTSDIIRDAATTLARTAEEPVVDHIDGKLRDVYEKTGVDPQAIVEEARHDPTVVQDLASQNVEVPKTIAAYHGSPYEFDAFDASKIGTGEGAQAYGHGLYFAESKGVAESYAFIRGTGLTQDQLSQYYTPGRKVAPYGTREKIDTVLNYDAQTGLVTVERTEHGETSQVTYRDTGADKLKVVAEIGEPKASLYKVEIPQSVVDDMLDWDKPLNQQAPSIIEKLKAAGIWPGDGAAALTKGGQFYRDLAGPRAYQGFGPGEGGLSKAGITGIRYLDQGSRAEGKGTSNFVLFDAEHAKIIERNGKPVEPEAPQTVGYWEGPGGEFTETTEVPSLAERAKELALSDRRWYAVETPKDMIEQGKAALKAGKTPQEAVSGMTPPPKEPTITAYGGEPPGPKGPPRSDAEKTILSKIVQENEPFYVTLKNLVLQPRRTLSKLYTEGIDRFNPIKVAEREAGGPAKFAEGVGPYEAQRLTAGTFGRGALFLEYGPRKFGDLTKKVAPSLFETLDSVKDNPRGFEAYIVSKHAIEVEERGMKSGFDLEAAKQVVKDGEAKFQPALDNWVKYGDALLDYVVDAGLVGKEGAAAMREAYKSYVPFYRFFEEQARPVSGQPRSPIKRMKGSERDTVDPIVSRIKDTFLFLALAEKNAARQKMVELGPEFAKPVMQKVSAEPAKAAGEYEKQLEMFLEGGDVEKAPEQLSAFKPSSYQTGANQIAVFENGVRRIYEVDPEVARAFNATDASSASVLASMLRASASLLRAGVTLAPEFSPRNLARDAISAFVYVGSHPIKTVKGAISLWKGDEAFQRWMAGGGANAAMVSMDRAYINKEIFRLQEDTGFLSSAWNIAKTPIETLRIVSEFMENMTRLGAVRDEMLQAKTGAKIQALSLISREATVDFARHGADPFLQKWSTATAFLNPQLQGVDVMFRKMAENPTGTTARALGAITLPSLYLWWANHDDFRWKDMANWERDLFWIVFHGHKTQAEWDAMSQADKEKFLQENRTDRIPKAFELGVLFGSVPERILDAYVDEKPDAFKQFGKTMLNVFGFNVIPTAAVPPLEHMTNRSFFTDRPLIPNSMEKILPEYQYTPYTTQATRALGHIVGTLPGLHDSSFASPVVIDNYIRGWSGTLGTYAVQIADAALRKTGVLPDPIKPASTLADIPVVKAFVIRYPSAQAQTIQDFHDHYAHAQMVTATIHHLALQGDAEAAIREAQMDPGALAKLDGIQKGLANAQRMIQMVDRNQSIKADEKRQIIDATYLQMIQMATAGNAVVLALEQGLKQKPITVPPSETVH